MTVTQFVIALAVCLAITAPAAAKKVSDHDRFQLWNSSLNECGQLGLTVEDLSKYAAKIGLKKKAITIIVRDKLRAARLYWKIADSWLYVQVQVYESAYSIIISYLKTLKDPASGIVGYARTWQLDGMGAHEENSAIILSSVSREVDEFIDEYLRVNAPACKS